MKNTNQVVLKSVGAATLLAVTFALGYILGSNSQKSTMQTEKSLSSTNIEHAFGKMNKDQRATSQTTPQEPMVKSLGGLEMKVAADPANIDLQLLLAQTYKEIVITVILALGWLVTSSQKYYKPGDNVGYNMGLVGGILLLMLLLYPLRKCVRILRSVGLLPVWFIWHMVLGIVAPTLILFHSTFQIGSINAGVALGAMLLVSGSGIFGRFFYTKIRILKLRQMSLTVIDNSFRWVFAGTSSSRLAAQSLGQNSSR